jgi:hypothetical protein
MNARTLAPARLACVLLLLAAARPAATAFVNGVETFEGTTKDLATWDEYNTFMSDNAITRNGSLNFRYVPPPGSLPGSVQSDYTARTAAIGVGQGAGVDVRVNHATAPVSVSLYLTDNTDGPSQGVFADDNFVVMFLDQVNPNTVRVGRGGNGRASGLGTSIPGTFPMTPGAHYTFQIERPDLNTARFSVFDASRQLLGSTTADVTGLPATLYPAFGVSGAEILRGQDYSIDFDNVRIIPEPATGVLAGWLGVGAVARPASLGIAAAQVLPV